MSHHSSFLVFLLFLEFVSPCVQPFRQNLSVMAFREIRQLCHVTNVISEFSCAQLCMRESKCAAVRYDRSRDSCDLLASISRFIDGDMVLNPYHDRPIQVLAIPKRGFHECPPSYVASSGLLRYRLVDRKVTWFEAEYFCYQNGGRLAELNTKRMRMAVSHLMKFNSVSEVWLGGIQYTNAKEPADGWRWHNSRASIDGHMWNFNEPDNKNGIEHVTNARLVGGLLFLHDENFYKRSFFVCECNILGWLEASIYVLFRIKILTIQDSCEMLTRSIQDLLNKISSVLKKKQEIFNSTKSLYYGFWRDHISCFVIKKCLELQLLLKYSLTIKLDLSYVDLHLYKCRSHCVTFRPITMRVYRVHDCT